jgi:hypothetical protein
MAKERLLDEVMRKLEFDFQSFRKEIGELQHVVDLKALTKAQREIIKKKIGEDKYYSEGGTGDFLVLKDRRQFKKIENTLNSFREQRTETGRLSRVAGQTSEQRIEEFTIKRSRAASARLGHQINEKSKGFLKYSSPEFVAEFEDDITRKLNKYKIKFNLPADSSKVLQDRLISSVRTAVTSELKDLRPNTALHRSMEERTKALGIAFTKGKDYKSVKKLKEKRKSNKVTKTNKSYYIPLRSSAGIFISALSLQNTLNLLLHDTIQSNFMKSSSFPVHENYLRYQTGRFARSATVENVSKSGDTLSIDFDYLTNPYETFTGGAHGPGRNPENIIEGAIRHILITHVSNEFKALIRKI